MTPGRGVVQFDKTRQEIPKRPQVEASNDGGRREMPTNAERGPKMDEPLLARKKLADLLDISVRSLDRKCSAGLIPRPVDLQGTKRWVRSEISEWIAAGRPPRSRWESMRSKAGKSRG
jgi:predicted DNA-binding transcriptional regulator AlpA